MLPVYFSKKKPRGPVGVGSPVLEPSRVAWNRRPAGQLARAPPPLVGFWPCPGGPLPSRTPLVRKPASRTQHAAAAAGQQQRAPTDRSTWPPGAGAAACRRTFPAAPTSTPCSGSAGSAPTPSSGAPTGGSPWYVRSVIAEDNAVLLFVSSSSLSRLASSSRSRTIFRWA